MVCKDFNMKQMLIVRLIGKKESKKEPVLISTMKINLKGIILMERDMDLAYINLRMEAFIKVNGTKTLCMVRVFMFGLTKLCMKDSSK